MKSVLASLVVMSTLAFSASTFAQCPGDLNGDGSTGFADLNQLLGVWGSCPGCPEDLNGDDSVGFSDLNALLADWACVVPIGDTTQVSGVVLNNLTSGPIEAEVTIGDETVLTLPDGSYSGLFTSGMVTITIEADFFNEFTNDVMLIPDTPFVQNANLDPIANVVVNVNVSGSSTPGETATAMAEVIVLDGSTVTGFEWSQIGGATAVLSDAMTDTVSVDLPAMGEFKAHLVDVLKEPPLGPEDLPPNVPVPDGEFPGGLQDRFEVVGMSPWSIEEAGAVMLEVDVTTTSGTYTGDGDVHAGLPWKPTSGLRTVPIGIPVLMNGKTQASYNWGLVTPGASAATLDDPLGQYPAFTPDAPGVYDVTVMDQGAGSMVTMKVYAGNWRGVIVGKDAEDRPISDTSCTGCHANLGYDTFTPWAQTGHAEILTQNLDTSTHYGPNCFSCHMVGFDPTVQNGGADEASDYQAFLDSGLINSPGDNWTAMLAQFPSVARRSNVQCEQCHGPQWGYSGTTIASHGPLNPAGSPRASIRSEVCATCHGEPLRHARFQQWQLSPHANYELAIEEGESGSCSRCHTGNGFLAWLPILSGDEPGDPLDDITVTWTADEVHPQTCVTCHDPHMAGTTSGNDSNATVRISGNTPPLIAGFTAFDVGRGAICMTCHNSRRGLRNDSNFDDIYQTSEAARAPHGGVQADVLMGENAYFVTTGVRGSHSTGIVEDTCVTCHMEATPPPALLSYNQSGTNHTFYARIEVCGECHGFGSGEGFQASAQTSLDTVETLLTNAILDLMDAQIAAAPGNFIRLGSDGVINDTADVLEMTFGSSRGRQAITVTFTDTTVVGPVRMTDVEVRNGATNLGDLYDFADPVLPKAGWNWNLVYYDGSLGVHNVAWTNTVLSETISALTNLAQEGPAPVGRPERTAPVVGAKSIR